mmetsp:Transcript_127657/g.367365  ORF Transcript_127657/g.367365 Transcript_127657/m.367365 type:complete len:262 (-) Transcript_127657:66-851(-)
MAPARPCRIRTLWRGAWAVVCRWRWRPGTASPRSAGGWRREWRSCRQTCRRRKSCTTRCIRSCWTSSRPCGIIARARPQRWRKLGSSPARSAPRRRIGLPPNCSRLGPRSTAWRCRLRRQSAARKSCGARSRPCGCKARMTKFGWSWSGLVKKSSFCGPRSSAWRTCCATRTQSLRSSGSEPPMRSRGSASCSRAGSSRRETRSSAGSSATANGAKHAWRGREPSWTRTARLCSWVASCSPASPTSSWSGCAGSRRTQWPC